MTVNGSDDCFNPDDLRAFTIFVQIVGLLSFDRRSIRTLKRVRNIQVDWLFFGASLIAAVCNVITCVCALRLHRRSADTMHVFVAMLTAGDLLLTGSKHAANQLSQICFQGFLIHAKFLRVKFHTCGR